MSLTEEQIALRKTGIGSSDIAAVCGVSPYQSPHNVYMAKLGLEDFAGNEATEIGNALETAIAKMWSERTGRAIWKNDTTEQGREPWMLATPDFGVNDAEEWLEVKNAGFRVMYQWGTGDDGVPLAYLAQTQWQMHVTGRTVCHLVALLGGCEVRTYTLRYDAELAASLERKARKFWFEHVIARVPPPIDGSDGARTLLTKLYPRSEARLLRADQETEALARALVDAKDAEARAKAAEQKAANLLKAHMKDADVITGDWWRATWKTQKDGKRPFKFTTQKDDSQ